MSVTSSEKGERRGVSARQARSSVGLKSLTGETRRYYATQRRTTRTAISISAANRTIGRIGPR